MARVYIDCPNCHVRNEMAGVSADGIDAFRVSSEERPCENCLEILPNSRAYMGQAEEGVVVPPHPPARG